MILKSHVLVKVEFMVFQWNFWKRSELQINWLWIMCWEADSDVWFPAWILAKCCRERSVQFLVDCKIDDIFQVPEPAHPDSSLNGGAYHWSLVLQRVQHLRYNQIIWQVDIIYHIYIHIPGKRMNYIIRTILMVTKYWWPGWWGRFGATLKRPILYRDQHFPIENPQEMVEFSLFSSHGQTNLFF